MCDMAAKSSRDRPIKDYKKLHEEGFGESVFSPAGSPVKSAVQLREPELHSGEPVKSTSAKSAFETERDELRQRLQKLREEQELRRLREEVEAAEKDLHRPVSRGDEPKPVKEGKYHEQIQIENDSSGHSYERIFQRFIDEDLTEVTVEDPYIRSTHQLYNFLRFCELLIKSPAKVSKIILITGQDEHFDQRKSQEKKLEELYTSLLSYNVTLEVNYSNTLHDREIRFNNGWIIKIGRGLDIYKATNSKFCIGFCDYDLRKCHATTVDIFHRKHVNQTYSAS